MTLHPQRSPTDTVKLKRLHARIRACTRCVAAGYLEQAAPVVAGAIRDRVMIVGQAPGVVELTTRVPFSGRAGAELRRWLAHAGNPPDARPCRPAVPQCRHARAPVGARGARPSAPRSAPCSPSHHSM